MSSDRKNLVHQASLVDVEKMTSSVLNGLYNFKKPEQAINAGKVANQWHEIQPVTTVSSTVFNGVNNFVDFNVPMHMNYIERCYFEITLANGSADTNCVFASAPCNLLSRVEVRVGGDIKDTRRDRDLFLEYVLFSDPWHLQKFEASTAVDPTSFALDTTYGTVAYGGSRTWRIPLNTILNGLPPCILNKQVVIRCYSQNVSNLLASGTASDLTCSTFKLFMEELDSDDNKLKMLATKNLDWRCVVPLHETAQVALTSGSKSTYITNNFSEADMYSHIAVLIQNTTQTGANIDQALDNASSIYLEDQSGQNLSNGVQWTNTQLLYDIYPAKFPNMLSQTANKAVYIVDCPSENPVEAYKSGVVRGARTCKKNMKVAINASASATRLVDIIVYAYKHIRVEKGELNVY